MSGYSRRGSYIGSYDESDDDYMYTLEDEWEYLDQIIRDQEEELASLTTEQIYVCLMTKKPYHGFSGLRLSLKELKRLLPEVEAREIAAERKMLQDTLPLDYLYSIVKEKSFCYNNTRSLTLEQVEELLTELEPEENSKKRQLRRMKKVKEELITVAMHPSRIIQCGLGG